MERQNVLLKSGNGTVAAADYDAKVHGPAVEETDEQYQARVEGKRGPQGAPAPLTTTIANLQTYDPADLPAPPTPVPHAGLSTGVKGQGQKVATVAAEGDQKGEAAKAKADADAKAKARDVRS